MSLMPSSTSIRLRFNTTKGFDIHALHTLLFRGWTALAGGLSIILIPFFLSSTQQDFYFIFASVLALQVFFELGLNHVNIRKVIQEAGLLRHLGLG
jgi:hypothetical protein